MGTHDDENKTKTWFRVISYGV